MTISIVKRVRKIFGENGYLVSEGAEQEQLTLDSLQFISIMCDIESQFDIEVPDEYLSGVSLDSFENFCNMIGSLLGDRRLALEALK